MKPLLNMGRLLLRGGSLRHFLVHTIKRNPAISTSKINDPQTTFAIALDRSHSPGRRQRLGSSKYRMRFVQIGGTPGVNVITVQSDSARTSSGLSSFRPCIAQLS